MLRRAGRSFSAVFAALLAAGPVVRAGDDAPRLFDFLRTQVADQKLFLKMTFRRDAFWGWAGMTAVTGALIATDHSSYRKTLRVGDRLSIPHTSQQKTFAKIDVPFTKYKWKLGGPYDSGTALYFLGDGITHTAIAASFLTYGLAEDDDRALRTSSQLAEAIIANGIAVQVLKHVTGRENPDPSTVRNGRWRFFPNQRDYARHVNKYDAFPSGHLATAMVTVTVVAENYPEKRWVWPVGSVLMTGLSFQMANNGVHWWSDYPLALYMGWAFGKIAAGRGTGRTAWEAEPSVVGGRAGIEVRRRFGGV
jgi:hypothetical protein